MKGKLVAAVEVDHIIALVNGGTHDRANLQSLCKTCHIDKTKRDLAELRSKARPGVDENGWPIDPAHPWNADPRDVVRSDDGDDGSPQSATGGGGSDLWAPGS